jgi:hypothetical protein
MRRSILAPAVFAVLPAALHAMPPSSAPAATARPAATEAAPVLPFIADDYPKALSEARAKRVPIFADAWAPW